MKAVNCVGIFCEDIREEKSGILTVIGIMPDNVNTEVVAVNSKGEADPAPHVTILPKVCIYLRINFDPDLDLPEADIRIVPPTGEPVAIGRIGRDVIDQARTQAKARGNLMAGLITRGVLGNYPFPPEGVMRLEVVFPKETILAAALNFKPKAEEATSST